jgi:hypothetical protein
MSPTRTGRSQWGRVNTGDAGYGTIQSVLLLATVNKDLDLTITSLVLDVTTLSDYQRNFENWERHVYVKSWDNETCMYKRHKLVTSIQRPTSSTQYCESVHWKQYLHLHTTTSFRIQALLAWHADARINEAFLLRSKNAAAEPPPDFPPVASLHAECVTPAWTVARRFWCASGRY